MFKYTLFVMPKTEIDLPPIVVAGEKYEIRGTTYEVFPANKEDKDGHWIDVGNGRGFNNQLEKDCAIGHWRDVTTSGRKPRSKRDKAAAQLKLGWWNSIKGQLEVPLP